MRYKVFIVFLFFASFSKLHSQDSAKKNYTFLQFEISVPLRVNQNAGEINAFTGEKETWFLPDGLGSRFGFGVHKNKWIGLGLFTGIEWKATNKLVVVPAYFNLRISPEIIDELRITLQSGLGRSFAIGRNNLVGTYQKYSLGLEDTDGLHFFIELSQYGFGIKEFDKIGSVSLGLSLVTF